MRWLYGITDSMDMGLDELGELVMDGESGHAAVHRVAKSQIRLSDFTHTVNAMVFPVLMYGCESWTIKEAECRRIDAFELWCWRRLLRVP